MIHTKELMLGNWVKYIIDDNVISSPVEIETISGRYVDVTNGEECWDLEDEELVGIPITEELLEKCGFTVKRCSGGFCINECTLYRHQAGCKFFIVFGLDSIRNLVYLHELQNAYFMLTRKHLEVKL